MCRIVTVNVNGLRSATRKGLWTWLAQIDPDVVCIQELKAQEADLSEEMRAPLGLQGVFHCAQKKGYSGVALYSKKKPDRIVRGIGQSTWDGEGRFLRADFGHLSVVSLYVPSGSSSLERQEAKFAFLDDFFPVMCALKAEGREFVVCGDWNIAHAPIDLKNWKGNLKNSGFLPQERDWLSRLYASGWVDVYRSLYPDVGEDAYTWWSNRGQAWAKNVGWRIDIQIATPAMASRAQNASVFKQARFSDHAPLIIDYAPDRAQGATPPCFAGTDS
jgi:exodeoxyribonuclease-3